VAGEDRSLAGRALVMLALFIGFYVLAAAVGVVLVAAPVLELMLAGQLHLQLLFVALAGLGILWSLVPRRREKWVDPGPRFTAQTQPELAELVRLVADAVGQDAPSELYLIDDMNAFVTMRGGFMGLGGRRVLAVGVPLLMVLDPDELASVLAHEFGHLHGGDTRLLPLVHQTRAAMGRTLNAASGRLRGIFKAYASFYLSRSQGISRAQELAADRLAASVTSPEHTARALARLPAAAAAFAYYQTNEYAPVLGAGRQPPYLAGFELMLANATSDNRSDLSADIALGTQTQSRFDSHPAPLDRIQALGVDLQTVDTHPTPEFPALALLRDREGVETALVAAHGGTGEPTRAHVPWDTVGDEVILPAWRATVTEQLLPAAPRITPAGLPTSADGLAELGSAIYQYAGRTATRPEREAAARQLCGRYLAVTAADAGWRMSSLPGDPIRFIRDGQTLNLLDAYVQVCAGKLDVDAWLAGLQNIGLTGTGADAGWTADHAPSRYATASTAGVGGAAAAPGPAPAGAAPATGTVEPSLQYRAKPGLRRELVIDGFTVQWGDQAIDAREVTAVGYNVASRGYEAQFSTTSGGLTFKVNSGSLDKKPREAWTTLVRWSQLCVEPRLVDQLLAELQATGKVQVASAEFTWDGVTTRKGRLRWEDFAGTAFTGTEVTLHRTADTLDGHASAGAVKTHIKHGGAVVPQLCQAILASRA
jgi:Zn-dependent protease with chaperone function